MSTSDTWLPQGQENIGKALANLNQRWQSGELMSLVCICETTDDSVLLVATQPENSLAMAGSLLGLANDIASSAMHDD